MKNARECSSSGNFKEENKPKKGKIDMMCAHVAYFRCFKPSGHCPAVMEGCRGVPATPATGHGMCGSPSCAVLQKSNSRSQIT